MTILRLYVNVLDAALLDHLLRNTRSVFVAICWALVWALALASSVFPDLVMTSRVNCCSLDSSSSCTSTLSVAVPTWAKNIVKGGV